MKTTRAFFLILFTLYSCKKYSDSTCMNNKIKTFIKNIECDEGAFVAKYSFQGETVYAFNEGYCIADGTTDIYNSNCSYIGFVGGFAGNTTVNGADWNTATLIEGIWSN